MGNKDLSYPRLPSEKNLVAGEYRFSLLKYH
jgi:hypothetical protein